MKRLIMRLDVISRLVLVYSYMTTLGEFSGNPTRLELSDGERRFLEQCKVIEDNVDQRGSKWMKVEQCEVIEIREVKVEQSG